MTRLGSIASYITSRLDTPSYMKDVRGQKDMKHRHAAPFKRWEKVNGLKRKINV